jgi:serine protease Do
MSFLQKLKQPKMLSFVLLLCTLTVGIVIGTIINTGVRADRQNGPTGAPGATPLTIPPAVPITTEFTKLAKRVEPSVVYIESDYLPKPGATAKRGHRHDDSDDPDADSTPHRGDPSDMLKKFFGGSDDQQNFRTEGSGTGFIVDKNGYIITNNHVIEKADRIKVRLSGDDTDYRARVIGYDAETDLAVLKIDAKQSLEPVQIGNSESVQTGDWVIAIGSPFGLQATVTAGIISAQRTNRDLPGAGTFQNFLQTDAAINPGNSGGPLLNTRGEVIGVNTMIATRSGSYEGIGFALPSNIAVKTYNDIIKQGRVVRGSIGIKFTHTGRETDTLAAFGLDHGVLVESVSPEGPAGKSGVKADDVIVAMNDRPVKDGQELVNKVADLPIGSSALFTVDRDGKRLDYKVTIGERSVVWQGEPELGEARQPDVPPGIPDTPKQAAVPAKFGMFVQRLTPRERKDMQIDASNGVKVSSVDPGSFADDIGMQEGDAILSINRRPIGSPDDLMKVEASLKPGQPVAVHVVRNFGPNGTKRAQPERYYLSGKLPEE